MSHPQPALNGLEQAAITVIAVEQYAWNSKGALRAAAYEAFCDALKNYVTQESEYFGIEPEYFSAFQRAKELCKGL